MDNFQGWESVTLTDLTIAYRKAKADAFFENTYPTAIKFAKYEEDLHDNLSSLLKVVNAGGIFSIKGISGEFRVIPKKLGYKPKAGVSPLGHVYFSDPERSSRHLHQYSDVVPEFRVVGDFPVSAHILSALWMRYIGEKIDSRLTSTCYGARLRRVRAGSACDAVSDAGEFHLKAVGSFPPYYQAYRRWRSDGLDAIRGELKAGREVVAASLDLKSYYHRVDPSVIAKKGFLRQLGVNLSQSEYAFHKKFAAFLSKWSKSAEKYVAALTSGGSPPAGGLVIGLTASRVVSNAILHFWDSLILEKLTPVHYGRYVDDMFIVLRDGGGIENAEHFLSHVAERIGVDFLKKDQGDPSRWIISGEWTGSSDISLQADKQKLFILAGRGGVDLIDSIESEIADLSSEHRLLPLPDDLENSQAARVLTAAGVVGDSADTLRRADGLTIRRLGWAMQLRHVETLARDLPKHEWENQRKKFYEFARDHVLRPDALFAHFNYVPRLVGFAIALGEWAEAEEIVQTVSKSLKNLEGRASSKHSVVINGACRDTGSQVWLAVRSSLSTLLLDSLVRSIPLKYLAGHALPSAASPLISKILGDDAKIYEDAILKAALDVAQVDLAKISFKNLSGQYGASRLPSKLPVKNEEELARSLADAGFVDNAVLSEFRQVRREINKLPGVPSRTSAMPYLFPTRPLTIAEISEQAPCCLDPALGTAGLQRLATFAETLRGVWVRKATVDSGSAQGTLDSIFGGKRTINVGLQKKSHIRVAVPSLFVGDMEWEGSAAGRSSLTKTRYSAIAKIVNDTLKLEPRPDYLVLPELSLPIEWVESVSGRLISAGISLIAGTEYRHLEGGKVYSEACLCLTDDRLGFPSSVRVWQPKVKPAVHEEYELISVHGKEWISDPPGRVQEKPVYSHEGFFFGVMVCSELQNSKERIAFQGEVDSLFVLCWNQDIETFSSLVDAASLDVHAYTVLVNNRKYGDSRVRAPARKSFSRDLARIRGGENDFVISVSLDLKALRSFQSRAKRWPKEADKFKAVPEGFEMSPRRKSIAK
ncbi:RNA-directed DNA polymerase [Stenotrophomonas sp. C3(2023)]|uniref:RNA-directed DNA polymerase n=1 Tax=Stenotrophomonas sp. C3(2023) TaxID=3080277 RepID=UPI00293C9CE8|nr:RNA-directed DNA polymerase [Stenotrophomonas sp. C3(2023)]MDV3470186.1 RNA-directed DNA polymerase [Stenotrophomonas sp. C3(2023)]